ncbi:MAG: IS630 transposase-related protein [Chlamydia sp.]
MIYSLEIGQKALKYLANSGTRTEANQIFGIATRTISHSLLRAK